VFFDYNMNVRVKTLSAPYSPRTVPGAPVSMPIAWKDLEKAGPLDFTIDNVPKLLAARGDLWRDMLDAKQKLESVLSTSAESYESASPRSPRGRPRRRSD
jgi:bifunctional non-homologous end joining protein LigD